MLVAVLLVAVLVACPLLDMQKLQQRLEEESGGPDYEVAFWGEIILNTKLAAFQQVKREYYRQHAPIRPKLPRSGRR